MLSNEPNGFTCTVWYNLSYVVRLNDLKTAQHLRARLALVLRHASGLAKPLHAALKKLFEISGVLVRNVGSPNQTSP